MSWVSWHRHPPGSLLTRPYIGIHFTLLSCHLCPAEYLEDLSTSSDYLILDILVELGQTSVLVPSLAKLELLRLQLQHQYFSHLKNLNSSQMFLRQSPKTKYVYFVVNMFKYMEMAIN